MLDEITKLTELATEMMNGDGTAATLWLNTPAAIFDNKSPLEHATTKQGFIDVEDLIGRIRHGIFS